MYVWNKHKLHSHHFLSMHICTVQVSASVYSGYEPSERDWHADQSLDHDPSPDIHSSPASLDSPISPVSPSLPSHNQLEETQHTTGGGATVNSGTTVPTIKDTTLTSFVPPQTGEPQPLKTESREKSQEDCPLAEKVTMPLPPPPQENPDSDFGPIDVNVEIVEPAEFVRHDMRQRQHQQQQQLRPEYRQQGPDVMSSSEYHLSISIDTLDPKVKPTVKKFGNLLENCNDEGSDVSAPKPRVVEASKTGPEVWNNFERSTGNEKNNYYMYLNFFLSVCFVCRYR